MPLRRLKKTITGELQAVHPDGDVGGKQQLHHAHRVPDEHPCLGARRLQVHGLHEDRHPAILDLSCAWVLARATDFPVLDGRRIFFFRRCLSSKAIAVAADHRLCCGAQDDPCFLFLYRRAD